jgi:hypothetical protein
VVDIVAELAVVNALNSDGRLSVTPLAPIAVT